MKKKIIIKIAALFMTGILAVEAACLGIGENIVFAAENDSVESESDGSDSEFIVTSGTGWTLYGDGLLKICSEPKFECYNSDEYYPEWYYCRDRITKVEVGAFKSKSTAWWFYDCEKIKSISFNSGFDTSNVTDMSHMFHNCSSLTSLDISGLDTSNVINMSIMFYNCSSLKSLNVSGLVTSNVTNMKSMFCHCSSLTSLDVSSFDTSKVIDMTYMFAWCRSLTSLDLRDFDTANVKKMNCMFVYCSELTNLDVSSFDTSNVTGMNSMFAECGNLTSLDVSSFDTSNVTDMESMFCNCSRLTSLDVSSFDTSNVRDMTNMFKNCRCLTSLDVSGFVTSKVIDKDSMFEHCNSIERIKPFVGFTRSIDLPLVEMYDINGAAYTSFPEGLTEPMTLYASVPIASSATSVSMKKKTLNLDTEKRYKLSYTYAPLECTDEPVWSSSDSSVVSVNSVGLITSHSKEGTAVITVSLGTCSDSCKVTVGKAVTLEETYSIIFDANGGSGSMSPLTASVGQEIILCKNTFEKADNSFAGWNTSADGSGTSYTDEAKVKDIAPANGSVTLYAQWNKNTPEPTEITQGTPTPTPTPEFPEFDKRDTISTKIISGLPNGAQTLDAGGSVNLKAVATTADGRNISATWLAPVGHVLDAVSGEDGSLEIKAVGPGTAYVTAVSGTKTKTVKYIVKQAVKTVDTSVNAITLGISEKYRLCVTPDAPTTDKFYFESSDKNICSVDQRGLIKAKKTAGSATVTIYAYDLKSEKKNRPVASVAVNVEPKEATVVSVTDVSINYLGNKELYVGEMGYISTLINNGSNNGGAAVKYTMNNKGIIKIDTYGHVTAKKTGTVTITATCGGKADSITLTVKQPLKLYKVNKSYVKVVAPKAGKPSKKVTFTVKTDPTSRKFIEGGGKVIWTKTKHTGIRLISDDGKGKAVFEVPSSAFYDTIVTATISDPVTGKSYSLDCVIDVQ